MIPWLHVVLTGVLSLWPVPAKTDAGNTPVPYRSLLDEPGRRVRTTDAAVTGLLKEGMRRSATFAHLIATVNATDVIVYIQRVEKLAPGIAGQLMIVPIQGTHRYLRIQVLRTLAPYDTIAVIGHELRHAVEIAAAPDVRDPPGLVRLYRRIGQPGSGGRSFDTIAAQATGRRVRQELAS